MIMGSKTICMVVAAATTAVVSCASPESDGRKAAQMYCEAEKSSVEYCKLEYINLIDNFHSYNFTSRGEVRDKVSQIDDRAIELRTEKEQTARRFYQEKYDKYLTNQKKISEFRYAYRAYKEAAAYRDEDLSPLLMRIDSLRLTVVPSVPDLEKLKRDLVGRKISGLEDSYFGSNWYWITDSVSQIKEVYVTFEDCSTESYICDMHLVLQADGGAYEADIKAHYRLGREDDWTLDLIESNSIELVRTGKYGNCITSRRTGWFGEYEVEFINSCDAPLAVGGMVKYEYKDGWKKFCVIVDGNSSKRIGGLFWGSIADYKIEFVERP